MSESRVAFVTGGAGGIGSAVCRALAADGHKVAVADLLGTATKEVAAAVGGLAVDLDVTDLESVKAAVAKTTQELGPIGILANVAGWDQVQPFLEQSDEEILNIVDINLLGVMRVTREVLRGMVENGGGSIVNVSSDTARQGHPLASPYSSAKAGVEVFTKTMAGEFGKRGVRANVISPGAFKTPLLTSSQGVSYEQMEAVISAVTALGRIGDPSELAAAVAFFASDKASYITGQVLSVNGGIGMGGGM